MKKEDTKVSCKERVAGWISVAESFKVSANGFIISPFFP